MILYMSLPKNIIGIKMKLKEFEIRFIKSGPEQFEHFHISMSVSRYMYMKLISRYDDIGSPAERPLRFAYEEHPPFFPDIKNTIGKIQF